MCVGYLVRFKLVCCIDRLGFMVGSCWLFFLEIQYMFRKWFVVVVMFGVVVLVWVVVDVNIVNEDVFVGIKGIGFVCVKVIFDECGVCGLFRNVDDFVKCVKGMGGYIVEWFQQEGLMIGVVVGVGMMFVVVGKLVVVKFVVVLVCIVQK